MQAQKDTPIEMQCKDKFLLQSVIAPPGTTPKDITAEMSQGKSVVAKLTGKNYCSSTGEQTSSGVGSVDARKQKKGSSIHHLSITLVIIIGLQVT